MAKGGAMAMRLKREGVLPKTEAPSYEGPVDRSAMASLPPLVRVLLVVGLGVLFGFMWSSRSTGAMVAEWQVFVARFASMGTFASLACAFARRPASTRGLLLTCAVCLAGHVACDALSGLVGEGSETMALSAVSMVFEGVALAVMQLLYFEALAMGDVRRGLVMVGCSYLVAELAYFVVLFVPEGVFSAVLYLGEVVSFAALVYVRLGRMKGDSVPLSVSDGRSAEPDDGDSGCTLLGGAPLPAVIAFIVCLTLSWGLFAQMTGEGAHAFFDMTSEIVMVAVRLLLVVVCILAGQWLTFDKSAVLLAMLWATGILVVGLLWGYVNPSTSALVLKGSLYALQTFALVMVVRGASDCPHQFYRTCGLTMCALMFGHVSRLGMLLVFSNAPVEGASAMGVVSLASWLVGAALAIALPFGCGKVRRGDVLEGMPGVQALADPFFLTEAGARGIEFHRRFGRFCETYGLSERERDVLLETLHGYTVDAVGERLGVSRETVKTYLSRIYGRAGVGGRQELLGMLDTGDAD